MSSSTSTIYEINNLSDDEIYNILGVSPDIDDRQLEIVIQSKIKQFKNVNEELYTFFNNVYDYFFFEEIDNAPQPTKEGFDNNKTPTTTTTTNTTPQQTTLINQYTPEKTASLQQIVEYKSDNLNPILKETITKIITINSFDRDNKNNVSSNFTLTLSESLNNIVSLKLYSVQIPYTWYTVNNNIGSNYFVIQGVSPGINDGNHNILIDISSGNYTPTTLISAVQNSLLNARKVYSDISFGNTSITYNNSNALSTFNFDIQKRFNETDYYLGFPSNGWTNPNGPTANNSIAGYLGFNYINYFAFTLLSNQKELGLSSQTTTNDNTLSIYYLTNTNNSFKIIQYVPSIAGNNFNYNLYINNETTPDITTLYVKEIIVSFSLPINTYYTRSELFKDLSNVLVNNEFLDKNMSEIIRVDIDNIDYVNYGFSYFQMLLKLNRFTTQIYQNQKCVLVFPDETTNNNRSPIWIGSNSCFHYDISINELNNIYSETPSNIDTFVLTTTPYILFVCNNPCYDISVNNYYLPINLQLNTPITFTQYKTAINESFATAQNNTITTFNTNGDFNILNTYINLDKDSNVEFVIDINKNMNEDKYIMDITDTFLYNVLDISYNGQTIIDLSNNNIFYSTFNIQSAYLPFPNNTPLITFTLKPEYVGHTRTPTPFSVVETSSNPTTNPTIFNTISALESGINSLFATYQHSDGYLDSQNTILDISQNVLSGSTITLTINNNNTVNCVLKINIDKILTQKDYTMVLSDIANNDPLNILNYIETENPNYENTTWFNDLVFNTSSGNINGFISLLYYSNNTTSYTTFTGSSPIGTEIFTPPLNQGVPDPTYKQFFIVPQSSGVSDPANIISYTLTKNSYTRNELVQEINNFFNTNQFTKGSSITIIEKNGKEYTQIRLNIDKTFKSYDYNLVFYSPYNISQCSEFNFLKITTWDTCLGWILGFKKETEYLLANYWNSSTNSSQLIGDSVVSIFLYNSFIIVMDDFINNHLNNGLITISKRKTNTQINTIPTTYESITQERFSSSQNYSLNQSINSQLTTQNVFSPGIYLKDVFGIIPMDTSRLNNNDIFVQIASVLQDQKRIYFGPVNISRMRIALYTDRGQIIDLNGSDWSFQIIAEELYSPTK